MSEHVYKVRRDNIHMPGMAGENFVRLVNTTDGLAIRPVKLSQFPKTYNAETQVFEWRVQILSVVEEDPEAPDYMRCRIRKLTISADAEGNPILNEAH